MPAKRRPKAAPPKRKPTRTRVSFVDPSIRVSNVKRSVDWYKRMLDFEVDMAMPNKSKPAFVRLVSSAGAAIMISDGSDPITGKKAPANVKKAISARKAQRVVSLYVRVPSGINALYDTCRRKQATVIQPIVTQPYGMRDFSIRDPDGYEVAIGMEVAVPAAPPAAKKKAAPKKAAPKKAAPKKKATAKKKAAPKEKAAKK